MFAGHRSENGSHDSCWHGIVRKGIALTQLPGLVDDQTEGAGQKRELAAGVGQDVVNFLTRTVPEVESFGHRSGNIPSNPEQYDEPEQTPFHNNTFILRQKSECQLRGGGGGLKTVIRE